MNKTYQNENSIEDEKVMRENELIKKKTTLTEEREEKDEKKTKLRKIEESLKKPFFPPQTVTSSKFGDLKDRTVWTILMLLMFILFISLGNFYCSVLVFVVISLIFSELIDLSAYKERNQELKNYYLWNWYN
jgi:hypothetical protein